MPSRNEQMRARARLQLETPTYDDADTIKMQEQAAEYVREAKRRDTAEPDQLVSTVVDAVARNYFQYIIQKKRRVRALSLLATVLVTALFVAPAIAQTPYDGLWSVTVITKTGNCQPTALYPLIVVDGKVSGAADVSGNVGRNGVVKVSLRGAFANGQLSDHVGSGRWNAASAGMPCSGHWIATRQ